MQATNSIKRTWSKSQVSEYTDVLDIWDSGSHRYERWPDGTEVYWKVISRDLLDQGFVEVLQKMPPWKMPGQVIHQEQMPLQIHSSQRLQGQQHLPTLFQVGGWRIEQEPYYTDNSLEERGNQRVKTQQVGTSYSPRNQGQKQRTFQPRQQQRGGSSQPQQQPRGGSSQPQKKLQLPYRVQRIEP